MEATSKTHGKVRRFVRLGAVGIVAAIALSSTAAMASNVLEVPHTQAVTFRIVRQHVTRDA